MASALTVVGGVSAAIEILKKFTDGKSDMLPEDIMKVVEALPNMFIGGMDALDKIQKQIRDLFDLDHFIKKKKEIQEHMLKMGSEVEAEETTLIKELEILQTKAEHSLSMSKGIRQDVLAQGKLLIAVLEEADGANIEENVKCVLIACEAFQDFVKQIVPQIDTVIDSLRQTNEEAGKCLGTTQAVLQVVERRVKKLEEEKTAEVRAERMRGYWTSGVLGLFSFGLTAAIGAIVIECGTVPSIQSFFDSCAEKVKLYQDQFKVLRGKIERIKEVVQKEQDVLVSVKSSVLSTENLTKIVQKMPDKKVFKDQLLAAAKEMKTNAEGE